LLLVEVADLLLLVVVNVMLLVEVAELHKEHTQV
jgi:hypothetical protein